MGCKRARTRAFLSLVLGLGWVRHAAAQPSQPPQTTEAALQAMTDAAGVIFTGTVVGVRRPPQSAGSVGVVEIDFAVTDAVRGVTGRTYTLREWVGLWQANDEPFRPGQRYLMLLHRPNSAGLSSPVGGSDGAIPIHGAGNAVVSGPTAGVLPRISRVRGTADATTAPDTPGTETIDLGWVATHVAVPVTYRTAVPPVRPIYSPLLHAHASSSAQAGDAPDTSADAPEAVPDYDRAVSYSSVVNKLREWERDRHEAR